MTRKKSLQVEHRCYHLWPNFAVTFFSLEYFFSVRGWLNLRMRKSRIWRVNCIDNTGFYSNDYIVFYNRIILGQVNTVYRLVMVMRQTQTYFYAVYSLFDVFCGYI